MNARPYSIYVILARGGSKRLTRKNVRALGGIPLVARAVRTARWAALRLGNPARIVVSTDDAEIARLARQWGAETPFLRPCELSGDNVPSVPVLRHALAALEATGCRGSEIIHLQPTAPLTLPIDVVRTVRLFRTDPLRSAVTVQPASDEPVSLRFGLEGQLLVADSPALAAEARVALNGAVYVFTPEWLAAHDRLAEPRATRALLMSAQRCADIDTNDDLQDARSRWEAHVPWQRAGAFIVADFGDIDPANQAQARRCIDLAYHVGIEAVTFNVHDRAQPCRTPAAGPDDYAALAAYAALRKIVTIPQVNELARLEALDEHEPPALLVHTNGPQDEPFLRLAAATGRPVLVAQHDAGGRPNAAEAILRETGCTEFVVLRPRASTGNARQPWLAGSTPAGDARVIILPVMPHVIERDRGEGLHELHRVIETARHAELLTEPAGRPVPAR